MKLCFGTPSTIHYNLIQYEDVNTCFNHNGIASFPGGSVNKIQVSSSLEIEKEKYLRSLIKFG